MSLNRLSLVKKLTLSVLPTLIASGLVSYSIYQRASVKDTNGERAMRMVTLVNTSELEMVKMSEALRGYLLDPSNTGEYTKKKAADEAYGKNAEELGKLLTDAPEALALNQQMADYDEGELDKIENGVAELITSKSPDAVSFYASKYMPARALQTKNFSKLKTLVDEKAEAILTDIEKKRVSDAFQSIAMLLASVLFGVTCVLYVTTTNLKKAKILFDRVYGVSDQVSGAADQLQGSSASLSESVNEQASAIQETAASLDEVTAMVKKNSDNAGQSKNFARETKKVTFDGKASVSEMQNSMGEIAQSNQAIMTQVENGNQEIAKIVKLMSEISDKTKVINDIVFQTKLLSFNASVEAARAGEQGKGFSVVAEEIGNLAAMSGNAAKEISDKLAESSEQVSQIIERTRTGVETLIAQGRTKVERGVEISHKCGSLLDQISHDVDRVDQMVSEISLASDEQSKGVAEINKAVSQLDTVTQRNNDVARSSNAQADALSADSTNLRNLVDELYSLFNGSGAVATAVQTENSRSPQGERESETSDFKRAA